MKSVTDWRESLVDETGKILDHLARLETKKAKIVAPFDVQIAELESERDKMTSEFDSMIDVAQSDVRRMVLLLEESVKGTQRHAVYSKGRMTWDSALLKGYAIARPEILEMRKVGKPSVSIRKVK